MKRIAADEDRNHRVMMRHALPRRRGRGGWPEVRVRKETAFRLKERVVVPPGDDRTDDLHHVRTARGLIMPWRDHEVKPA